MEKKTFANKDMVGTPRGYVKKKDIERVDREMTPILEGATTVLSLTPIGRAVRAGKAAPKLIEKSSQKLLSGPQKAKEISKEAFEKAVTVPKQGRALEGMYRAEKATAAAKKAKEGRAGSFAVKGAEKKTAVAKIAKKAAPKKAGPDKKVPKKSDSGTFTSARRIGDVKKSRGPFGALVKRPDNLPKAAGGGSRGVQRFGQGAKLDSGKSRIVGLSPLGKAAVGAGVAGGAGTAAYLTRAKEGSAADRGFGPKSRQGSSAPSMAKKGGPEKRQGSSSPAMAKPPVPKAKPDRGKSKTRMAFEKEFAKQRKAGKKEFTFKGKKYNTKLAK